MNEDTRTTNGLPGRDLSLWLGTTERTSYPRLSGEVKVDVAVLGGGIAGITTAAMLREAGVSVAVVEARRIVESTTGNTTAKVTSLHNLIYRDLVKRHGEEQARLYGQANQAAIEWIRRTVREREIACDLAAADAFTYALDATTAREVTEEAEVAARLGLPADLTTDTGLPYPVLAAVRFRDQARFHPRRYLLALAAAIPDGKSAVFEESPAVDVQTGTTCSVRTAEACVRADRVVIATHQPFPLRGLYFARMTLKRSYALALALDGPVPQGMYISTEPNFRSMRPHAGPEGEVLILGGEPHAPGQAGDTTALVRRLEAWGRERFPVREVLYRWATQDNVTQDRLPYVGRLANANERVLVATGFGGWGMTNATAGAMLLADLALDRENPWKDLYDPGRSFVKTAVVGLVRDAVVGVKDLHGAWGGKDAPTDVRSLARGEGCVVDDGVAKVAVHRDEAGTLHAVSAVCTHLQCVVRWNGADRSWDCPCHGSRFDAAGKVLHGPALEDLAPAAIPEPPPSAPTAPR